MSDKKKSKLNMQTVIKLVKALLGDELVRRIRPLYHGTRAYFFALLNGFPGNKIKIIGVTGTKGKTTTTVFIGRLLNLLGVKAGYITTSVINLGDGEFLNKYKMSTLDEALTQKFLHKMVKNGSKVAVVEMSSQGLEQNRHAGIGGFDLALFLNLFPEHLEAHGGWEKYRNAKAVLFQKLKLNGWFLGNSDDWETDYMWQQVSHQDHDKKVLLSAKDFRSSQSNSSIFKEMEVEGQKVQTRLISNFDLSNAYFAARAAAVVTEHELSEVLPLISELETVPGRVEFVSQHQKFGKIKDLSVLVDYAHEPESMKLLLQTVESWKKQGFFDKIIHILSADGAGRDDWKKPAMGELSFKRADYTVITTDNYNDKDDPEEILRLLAQNCLKKEENKKYFKIIDRREAMRKALDLAANFSDQRVLIVSTGVGSEQGLTQPGGKIDWDERDVWRDLLE